MEQQSLFIKLAYLFKPITLMVNCPKNKNWLSWLLIPAFYMLFDYYKDNKLF